MWLGAEIADRAEFVWSYIIIEYLKFLHLAGSTRSTTKTALLSEMFLLCHKIKRFLPLLYVFSSDGMLLSNGLKLVVTLYRIFPPRLIN